VIGMIFLIDIDGWARSARIQVVLGKDYRGRGYSRDIMPRVMTYGLAPEPAGLGMHRIWVAVPEQNTRSVSVYQSLGFVPSGRSRDALWNASQNRYQDLIVMDTLVDEFDPIRSLDAFGMHVIEDNPGVKEALSAREHSIAIRLNERMLRSMMRKVRMSTMPRQLRNPCRKLLPMVLVTWPRLCGRTRKARNLRDKASMMIASPLLAMPMPKTAGRTRRASVRRRRKLGGARLVVVASAIRKVSDERRGSR